MNTEKTILKLSATALTRTQAPTLEWWLQERHNYIEVEYHQARIVFELHPPGTGERLAELERAVYDQEEVVPRTLTWKDDSDGTP